MDRQDQPAPRALVGVPDDARRAQAADALGREGIDAEPVGDATALLAAARALPPDLVVVHEGLPGGGATEVLGHLREFTDAYVIVLAAEADEVQAVLALSMGADDVVPAGISGRELGARARAMLRRPRHAPVRAEPLVVGQVTVDPMAREASCAGSALPLTRIEFDILWALAEQPRAVLDRARLGARVWGPRWVGDDHVLDVHVSNLRRKLAAAGNPVAVVTVRGVGFRVEPRA